MEKHKVRNSASSAEHSLWKGTKLRHVWQIWATAGNLAMRMYKDRKGEKRGWEAGAL